MKLTIFTFFSLIIYCSIAQIKIVEQPVRLLALGDSYTIGQDVPEEERWAELLLDSLKKKGIQTKEDAKIIATTGWRTDNLIQAIDAQKDDLEGSYTLVGLLIGVNNYYQGRPFALYEKEFEELLKTALSYANNDTNRVFVVSIPDYAYTPFGNGNENITTGINKFNAANLRITKSYNIPYVDITPISRNGLIDTELVASDGLHPSGKQYSLWVSEILKQMNFDQVTTSTISSRFFKNNEQTTIWNTIGHKVFEGNINDFDKKGNYIIEYNNQRFQVFFE